MKKQIKITFNYNLTILVLSIVCVLLGAAACILGELMTPFVMGVLSAIYLFDTKSKRSVSVIVSILLLALNVLAFFFKLSISLFAPASIILSMIVNRAFIRWHTKANTAYLMTLIAAVFSLIGYLLFAMIEAGSFTFDAVIAYYSGLADYLRNIFVESMMEIYIASGIKVTEEAVVTLFNQQIYMIISYILIGGFAITGIGMKVFSWITAYCSDNVVHIKNWRFKVAGVYAYFYILLVILSLFATTADSIFAVSVLNLYNIFMVVFAYVGFTVSLDTLKNRMKPVTATLMLIGVLLIFASFAAQILAAFGVLYSIRNEKLASGSSGSN